jgi:membrane-associated phospholipid phosphatase
MIQKLAKYVSILGHPFLTIPIYTLAINFSIYEIKKAFLISFTIVGCFFIPVILWNYINTKRGKYTNFDVSDQKQRNSMYVFALPLLTAVLFIFYLTHQSHALILTILFAVILLVISYLVNFAIKCSGHISLTIFLSFIILPKNLTAAFILLFCALIIGWSRIALKRHTFIEVLTGMIIGLITGLSMLYFQGYFNTLT